MEQAQPLLQQDPPEVEPESRLSLSRHDYQIQAKLPVSRWAVYRSKVICGMQLMLPRYLHPNRTKPKRNAHPTAYLDALRGCAAFIVYVYHGWGLPEIGFLQLPFIRVVFDGGPGMVAVFFVISGYVLSYRMLKMIRNEEPARLLDCLASSMFRRWLRLYVSTGAATFVAMLMVQLGWWLPFPDFRKDTFAEQVWHWFQDWVASSDPFANIEGWIHPNVFFTRYLAQMWTIPVEYRGSIVLFAFCTASCKLSTRGRWVFLLIVVFLSYYWRAVYVCEFLFGMLIADMSFSRYPERLSHIQGDDGIEKTGKHQQSVLSRILCSMAFILGFFLLGQPDASENLGLNGPFPWQYLSRMTPWWYGEAAYTFWLSIGAGLVVFALDSYPLLQKPFEWSFPQYLGQLSFGMYALHTLVIHALYENVLVSWQLKYLGPSPLAAIPGWLITTAAMLWLADYYTRFDDVVVKAGRWLQAQTFKKW